MKTDYSSPYYITEYDVKKVVNLAKEGHVSAFRIENEDNYPMFKIDDYAMLNRQDEYKKKDFVLYETTNGYYLKRILKIKTKREVVEIKDDDGNIIDLYHYDDKKFFLASDNDDVIHIAKEDQIIAKAIARQRKRKYYSLSIKSHRRPIYTFYKVNFLRTRFKNRVTDYDTESSYEALKNAYLITQKEKKEEKKKITHIENKDLESFETPTDYLKRYEESGEI